MRRLLSYVILVAAILAVSAAVYGASFTLERLYPSDTTTEFRNKLNRNVTNTEVHARSIENYTNAMPPIPLILTNEVDPVSLHTNGSNAMAGDLRMGNRHIRDAHTIHLSSTGLSKAVFIVTPRTNALFLQADEDVGGFAYTPCIVVYGTNFTGANGDIMLYAGGVTNPNRGSINFATGPTYSPRLKITQEGLILAYDSAITNLDYLSAVTYWAGGTNLYAEILNRLSASATQSLINADGGVWWIADENGNWQQSTNWRSLGAEYITLYGVAIETNYVVAGAGTATVNGTYTNAGIIHEGRPVWIKVDTDTNYIYWLSQWNMGVGTNYVGPETPYYANGVDSIPGTNEWFAIPGVGSDPSPTLTYQYIYDIDEIITAAGWRALSQRVDVVAQAGVDNSNRLDLLTGDLGSVSSRVDTLVGEYPVFRLDLGLVDLNWTDFEIKATTNNFTNLVYYYKSWTTQNVDYGDTNAWTYFTDDESADVRVWHRASNSIPISSHLVSTNSVVQWVYFYPSHECELDWTLWMASANSNLIWSYVRVDDLGFEMNRSGTLQRWNPVRPDSWEQERTVP